jgi:predicted transcriptional regulator
MSTSSILNPKQSVSFRWDSELVKHLKDLAKRQNRSLSNFTETLLAHAIASVSKKPDIPNDVTMAAINEARSNNNLETLDMDHFDDYVRNL